MADTKPDAEGTAEDKFWGKVIDGWKAKAKSERQEWNKMASMYRTMSNPRNGGNNSVEMDSETMVESNWLYAFADTLTANVVPTNPAVTIVSNRKALDGSAKLRTQLVNTLFKKEKMHQILWKLTTRASIWPRSWLKCVWHQDLKRPILRVINPHYVFFDSTAETEADMRYIIEVTVITKAEFNGRLKKQGKRGGFYRSDALEDPPEFGHWPKWIEPDSEWSEGAGKDVEATLVRDSYEWTTIYEVYDLVTKTFFHYADGIPRALLKEKLPYKFLKNPYKMMSFNDNLHDLGGMSDAELVAPTIERINEMDTLQMMHVKTAIPSPIVHEGLLDDPGSFLDAYTSVTGPGQPISLHARPNVKVTDVIGTTPMPTLPIEWSRARSDLESVIQFVLGMPSYQRGETGTSDVATELALTDTATRTRNARRQKVVYDVIEWSSASIVGLYQEFMDPDEKIPVRTLDTDKEEELTAELLEFGEGADDVWAWDYNSHPYTAAEQNEVVQLKMMETYMPVLQAGLGDGTIDKRKFYKKMLELLHMPELMGEPQAAPQAAPPGMPPAPGAPPPAGPEGVGPGVPNAAQPAMQGGEVAVGAGAQSVDSGAGGGFQGN